jgi:hypothetical protein
MLPPQQESCTSDSRHGCSHRASTDASMCILQFVYGSCIVAEGRVSTPLPFLQSHPTPYVHSGHLLSCRSCMSKVPSTASCRQGSQTALTPWMPTSRVCPKPTTSTLRQSRRCRTGPRSATQVCHLARCRCLHGSLEGDGSMNTSCCGVHHTYNQLMKMTACLRSGSTLHIPVSCHACLAGCHPAAAPWL